MNALKYSNDQLFRHSIILLCNDKNNININSINPNTNIYKNKDELFKIINIIDKNKLKLCHYCNKSFDKIQDNKNHLILECFSEHYLNVDNINTFNNIGTVNNNNIDTVNNIDTINNTLNSTNIFNITVNLENLVPFDKDWDITKIDNYKKK